MTEKVVLQDYDGTRTVALLLRSSEGVPKSVDSSPGQGKVWERYIETSEKDADGLPIYIRVDPFKGIEYKAFIEF